MAVRISLRAVSTCVPVFNLTNPHYTELASVVSEFREKQLTFLPSEKMKQVIENFFEYLVPG